MTVRLHVDGPLVPDHEFALPAGAARHAQVRRVQPGDTLLLFDGSGSDWPATVLAMGRAEVRVRTGRPQPVATELPRRVTLALGMPANERMDLLVEKATELGVAVIQPLHTQRSVLRLTGERAARKQAHWQAIAVAACEQCGRARVPQVAPVQDLLDWLPTVGGAHVDSPVGARLLLSLRPDARPLVERVAERVAERVGGRVGGRPADEAVITLSGAEGGFTDDEEGAARRNGFEPTTLGPRVLRADTAPLAALAALGAMR